MKNADILKHTDSETPMPHANPTSVRGTYVNEGTYKCECGYTKTMKNTDELRGGWQTIVRLHAKICPLVKSGARNAPKGICAVNSYRLSDADHQHLDQKKLHEEQKKIIAEACERAWISVKNE